MNCDFLTHQYFTICIFSKSIPPRPLRKLPARLLIALTITLACADSVVFNWGRVLALFTPLKDFSQQ